jgi:hypothetical protein
MLPGPDLASTKIIYNPDTFSDWTVEPSQAGLIAYTKSADGARRLELFCSAGRMKFKLTGRGVPYATTDFASSIGAIKEIQIAGVMVPAQTSRSQV